MGKSLALYVLQLLGGRGMDGVQRVIEPCLEKTIVHNSGKEWFCRVRVRRERERERDGDGRT